MAKAIDLGLTRFEGTVLESPKALSSGLSTIILSVKVYIRRNAFQSLEAAVDQNLKETPVKALKAPSKDKPKKATVVDETKDTETERILKERKYAINRLFSKLQLRPVYSDSIIRKHKKKGNLDSKRAMLEHFDGKAEKKLKAGDQKGKKEKEVSQSKSKDAKDKGKGKAEEEEEEGNEVSKNDVDQIFAKAVRNDMHLPEMNPPSSFTLQLRSILSVSASKSANKSCLHPGHIRDRLFSRYSLKRRDFLDHSSTAGCQTWKGALRRLEKRSLCTLFGRSE